MVWKIPVLHNMMPCNLVSIYRSILCRIPKYCKIILHQHLCKNSRCRITKYCKIIFHQHICKNLQCRIPKYCKIILHQHLFKNSRCRITKYCKIIFHQHLCKNSRCRITKYCKIILHLHLCKKCKTVDCNTVAFIAIFDHRRLKHTGLMIVYSCVFKYRWINFTKSPALCAANIS